MAPLEPSDETAAPFYVEGDHYCLGCAQQSAWPSKIWVFDEDAGECRIARQPETEQEVYEAVRGVQLSCVQAVRYRGDDVGIRRRLASLGQQDALDGPVPDDVALEPRRFATFRRESRDHARRLLRDLLRTAASGHSTLERRLVLGTRNAARVRLVWTWLCPGLRLTLRACERDATRWLLKLHRPWRKTPDAAVLNLSCTLHEVLLALGGDRDVRWYVGDPAHPPWPDGSPFPL